MNAQNTPVHVRLWHHDFWRMAIANMLLTMSAYILLPTLPRWMADSQNLSSSQVGLAMVAFALGLFLLGAFTSYLVQHFRRNVVCLWAIAGVAISLAFLYYLDSLRSQFADFWLILADRLLHGAAFGLAQMILSSTLIIDTCESYQRTEANHSLAWFGRFSLSLGPMAGIVLYPLAGFQGVVLAAAGCAVGAMVLLRLVSFPFRTPEDHIPHVSLDRFFLPHGTLLFLNLLLVMVATGLVLSLALDVRFYSLLMLGFLLAIIAQRFVFREAELKSEVVSGLLVMGAALLMLLLRHQQVVYFLSPLFIGFGLSIIASRFLLFFIKLSRHCQRGTSQSTFMLGWESGLALGLALGYGVFDCEARSVLSTALSLVALALLAYQYTHAWFLRNKNR